MSVEYQVETLVRHYRHSGACSADVSAELSWKSMMNVQSGGKPIGDFDGELMEEIAIRV